mgnify:CR=1 FL=1
MRLSCIVSANDTPDKLERAGFHTVKSEFVDAPVISELPMTLECKLLKFNEDGNVIGEIVNVCADESILDESGKIDPSKLEAITYDASTALISASATLSVKRLSTAKRYIFAFLPRDSRGFFL